MDMELCAARKQTEGQKVTNEESTNATKHLRKRLLLVLSVSHYTQGFATSSTLYLQKLYQRQMN
jgi:hypothetical protein